MRKALLALSAALIPTNIQAQDSKFINLKAMARVDYQREWTDGSTCHPNTGFKGKQVKILMDGHITPKLSYTLRHRLDKMHKNQSFFDATDRVYLTYKPDKHWSLSGGKLMAAIGGFEYDRSSISLYCASEFWNNIPCYQMGVSATCTIGAGNDHILAQAMQSPWHTSDSDMYAYSLMWTGRHGRYSSLWSANLMEYRPGKHILYLTLGNELRFGNTCLQVDLMNRSVGHHPLLLRDCSVMAELSYRCRQINLFCKTTYDVNATGQEGDYCVYDGTEMKSAGAGIEYYPLKKNDDVRLHANAMYAWGRNGNPEGVVLPNQTRVDVGVTWTMNILKK